MAKKRRTRNKEVHRQAILDATHELIQEKGYGKTTIRDIAHRANVSVGLVYKDFPAGKEDIVVQLFQHGVEQKVDLEAITRVEIGQIPVIIRDLITNLLHLHEEGSALNAALETACLENPHLLKNIEKYLDTHLSIFPPFLAHLNEQGVIRVENSGKTAHLLAHTIDAVIHRHVLLSPLCDTDDDLVDFLVDLVLKNLGFQKGKMRG